MKALFKKKKSPIKWKEIQYRDEDNKIKIALVPSHMTVQKSEPKLEQFTEYYDTESESGIDSILDTYTDTTNSNTGKTKGKSQSSSSTGTPVSNIFKGKTYSSSSTGTPVSNIFKGKTYSSSSSNSSDFFIPFVASPTSYYTKTGL
jgi:hypothetical protein